MNASLQEMVEKARLHREKRQFDRSIFKFAGKTLVFDAFNKFRQHRKQKKGMTNSEEKMTCWDMIRWSRNKWRMEENGAG